MSITQSPDKLRFDGEVALVTGAGSGIGRAVALALQADGFDVVLAGRRTEPLEVTKAVAPSDGGQILVCPTDISDPASVAALFDITKQHFGRLDVLFNNAGIWPPSTRWKPTCWKRVVTPSWPIWPQAWPTRSEIHCIPSASTQGGWSSTWTGTGPREDARR